MSTRSKRLISLILTAIMLMSVLLPIAAAEEEKELDIPIVYVLGQGLALFNEAGEKVFPFEYDQMAYIKEQAPAVLKELGKALLTGNYDGYCDSLLNAFAPIYDNVRLDKDGNISNGVYPQWRWQDDYLPEKSSGFTTDDYVFMYDWRVDPLETADILDEYIDYVLSITGAEKITLIGRCLGSCVTSAYLAKYGEKNLVANYIMYVPMCTGSKVTGSLFTGELTIDPNTVDMYASYILQNDNLVEDEALSDFLCTLVSFLNIADVLDLTTETLEGIYAKVKEDLVPRMVLSSYGSFPSYWAMVSAEDYEKAKSFVFDGVEDEYAGFIEKIDYYNETVKEPLKDILDTLKEEQGMNISVIAKYGLNAAPIFEGSNNEADGRIDLQCISLGATSSTMDSTFSDEYIAEAVANGTDKYISPDKKVDASTCWYPDTTWFIKNVPHSDFPDDLERLLVAISSSKGEITIWDDEQLPQYLIYNSETDLMSPLTAENDKGLTSWTHDVPTILIRFFKQLFELLKRLFSGV